MFGAGNYGKEIVLRLLSAGINVNSVLVSNKNNNPDNIEDVPVKEIRDVDYISDKNIIIFAIQNLYNSEIIESLKQIGFSRIIPVVSLSDEWVMRK